MSLPMRKDAISPDVAAPAYREPPHNTEAEQALLGTVLTNNAALNQIGDRLQAEHFYLPVHQRIFQAIMKCVDRGLVANPVTLKPYFEQDEALSDVGGGGYLARLAAAAGTVINIRDYSETIVDLALKRALIILGEEVVNRAFQVDLDQPALRHIEQAEQQLFTLSNSGTGERSFRPLRDTLAEAIARAETAYKNTSGVVGVTTGLRDLDQLLGGLQRSELIILAGRPSMGKTALATNIAYNACRHFHRQAEEDGVKPRSVGFFSLEMSGEQLANRIVSSAASINSSKLLKGEITQTEFDKLVVTSHEIAGLPFHIDDTPALSIAAMRTRARRLKRTQNVGLIVVDYLQLLRGVSAQSQGNRVQEISEITQGLKAIAKELEVPVLALSQLSRKVEERDDKKPQLADLRESGSIEQDADVVMFVYREEYYLSRKQPRDGSAEMAAWQEQMDRAHGVAEVIVAKQRNGPIDNVQLQFQSDLTRFSDLARNDRFPEYRGN